MNKNTAYESVTKRASTEPPYIELDDEAIRDLAYRLWVCRGRPTGSPEFDWYRAEEEVKNAVKVRAS
jgi:hypothetical protein